MHYYAVVVAGGQGTRLGFPKQYAKLAGKPMWEWAVLALLSGGVHKVWLVVPQTDVVLVAGHVAQLGSRDVCVVAGGASRSESVNNGLQQIFATESNLSNVLVAIHDAARPFVSFADVRSTLRVAEEFGGAMLGQPCVDTMKRVLDERVTATVRRDGLWHAQTPQVFRADWLQHAYRQMGELEVTDDASLMEAVGYPVHMVPATDFNGKVTTPADMEFAKWLAERRWGGEKT